MAGKENEKYLAEFAKSINFILSLDDNMFEIAKGLIRAESNSRLADKVLEEIRYEDSQQYPCIINNRV